jgi:Mn2+/Fe2+ NRAMP family transporter
MENLGLRQINSLVYAVLIMGNLQGILRFSGNFSFFSTFSSMHFKITFTHLPNKHAKGILNSIFGRVEAIVLILLNYEGENNEDSAPVVGLDSYRIERLRNTKRR